MWLEGLSAKQVDAAAREGGKAGGFIESHIWVSQIKRINDEQESHVLAEIDIIGRCIDMVRRVAPDIQTHRVFLASVRPTGPMPGADPRAEADVEMPRFIKKFDLWSVGYACKPSDATELDLVTTFFETNTSFLFYPRFYLDYCINCSDPAGKWMDYAHVEKLTGRPKYSSPANYPQRIIETGEPEHFPKAPADPTSSSTIPIRAFWESHIDWITAQSSRYCNETPVNGDSSALWSICVACNILPDSRHVMSNDQMLNARCALFLTVSTEEDKFKELAPHFVGQVKARLAQWNAEALYELFTAESDKVKVQMDELNKKAQMLELMQRPLRRISDALSTMHSDTQELRALMFEPEESLFASFSNIAPFFVEGSRLPIKLDGERQIDIRHSPGDYTEKELPIVLACVLCAIFGELGKLEPLRRANLVLAVAAGALDDLSDRSATRELVETLKWLVGLLDRDGKPDPLRSLASLLSGPTDDMVIALMYIKQALFSPFKAGAPTWDPIAFRLLARNAKLGSRVLNDRLNSPEQLKLPNSPINYASVLAFVRDIASALTTDGRKVISLTWSILSSGNRCEIEFNSDIPIDGTHGINRRHLADILKVVSTCPREWRIQDANYGDTTRPFVYLANKILGLGVSDDGQWAIVNIDEFRSDEVFVIRQTNGQQGRFSVECPSRGIALKWENL
jgi:hypothetical protein